MNEEVKYLDLQGLSLYDQNIKDFINTKDTEIKIKQTLGKSNGGTILVTPGGTIPATYYTAEEAAIYNDANNLNEGDEGYVQEGDLKTEAVTTSTNIDVNIDNETIIQDPTTKKLQVASSALTQYIGDEDAQGKYAIAIGQPDANNNKTVSLDINANSNAIEKTETGVKVRLELHKFADPSQFGTNVKEAYALTANGTVLTGSSNEQVIKVYKDSALQDIKLLHAIPAVTYTAETAAAYNANLTGAIAPSTALTIDQAAAVNDALGTSYAENDGISAEDAAAYNATLEGAKAAGDQASAAVKPTYTKLGGWVDIAANQRSESNLALCYAYENADGTIVIEAVQVGSFLRENEFKAGLQVNDSGEVSVKVTSEKVRIADTPSGVTPGSAEDTGLVDVLTADQAHGVQVNHIQDAINYAAADSKTTITEVAADSTIPAGGAPKVLVSKTIEADGHANYVISGQDLASAVALAAEIIRAGQAETAIDSVVGLTKASGSEVRTYTNAGNYIGKESVNTIKSDIKALDTKLKQVSDKLDAMIPITDAEINSLFA